MLCPHVMAKMQVRAVYRLSAQASNLVVIRKNLSENFWSKKIGLNRAATKPKWQTSLGSFGMDSWDYSVGLFIVNIPCKFDSAKWSGSDFSKLWINCISFCHALPKAHDANKKVLVTHLSSVRGPKLVEMKQNLFANLSLKNPWNYPKDLEMATSEKNDVFRHGLLRLFLMVYPK